MDLSCLRSEAVLCCEKFYLFQIELIEQRGYDCWNTGFEIFVPMKMN